MLKVKGVIFDMDGLMINSEQIALDSNLEAAKQLNIELTKTVALELIGRNIENTYEYLKETYGNDYPCVALRQRAIALRQAYYQNHDIEVKEGLYDLLEYLKKQNIKMAVASSTKTEKVISNLNKIKVIDYFDYIVGGDQEPKGKPAPDIFLNACAGLQIKPSEALVLEDSKNGILASYNANIKVICIPDLIKHNQEITALTYKTLNSLKEVINYVK